MVDANHPACLEHITTVNSVLEELGVAENPVKMVFNKVDLLHDNSQREALEMEYPDSIWVSAHTGDGIEDLKWAIYNHLEGERVTLNLQIPQSEGKLLSDLHRVGEVLHTAYEGNDVILEIKLNQNNAQKLLPNNRYKLETTS